MPCRIGVAKTAEADHAAGGNVTSWEDGYWEWFEAPEPAPYEITGKYLFFSEDRALLVALAQAELTRGGFHRAKTHAVNTKPPGEYVLCLYYEDDSRKHELAQRHGQTPGLKYRYWKSDEATRRRQYSDAFKENLISRRKTQSGQEEGD